MMNSKKTITMDAKEIIMEHQGEHFLATVDEELYNQLIEDPEKKLKYSKLVHEHVYGCIEAEKLDESSGTNVSKWTPSCIELLITERLSKEEEFNRPSCKKKKLWHGISKALEEKSGSYFDANSCDIKYRNMLSTYRNNKKRQQQCSEGAINWKYFQQFDDVFGHKTSSLPPENTLGDSLLLAKRPVSSPPTPPPCVESVHVEEVQHVVTEKKKTKLSVSEYLVIKLERELKERKEQLDLRKKQLVLKEKIWKEKKLFQEQEIKAILQLAKGMVKTNGE